MIGKPSKSWLFWGGGKQTLLAELFSTIEISQIAIFNSKQKRFGHSKLVVIIQIERIMPLNLTVSLLVPPQYTVTHNIKFMTLGVL